MLFVNIHWLPQITEKCLLITWCSLCLVLYRDIHWWQLALREADASTINEWKNKWVSEWVSVENSGPNSTAEKNSCLHGCHLFYGLDPIVFQYALVSLIYRCSFSSAPAAAAAAAAADDDDDRKNVQLTPRSVLVWQTETGRQFDYKAEDFTLERIIEWGFDQYSDKIKDISSAASKELAIETGLADISSTWENLAFDLVSYKEKGHLKIRFLTLHSLLTNYMLP